MTVAIYGNRRCGCYRLIRDDLFFVLVGTRGWKVKEVIEEINRDPLLQNKVIFTGSIHENDLPDIYRAAHLFSLVSDKGHMRGEGIPLTPLEAMATGIPVLVGNQDGSQEAVENGVNGYVLDPFDPLFSIIN